ncbi:MAG TPA: DUF1523 family protein [Paenirhodobacter sp.]
MRCVKATFWTLVVLVVVGFLHYTLPQHDVVRVVGTYQQRVDIGGWTRVFWSGSSKTQITQVNRDVQFIQAVKPNGKAIVYRNEDTGWGWPPYFKFDTATLQAKADDLKSTPETPKWAVVTHYGWRMDMLSIFPNAISVKAVAGPDVRVIPWASIIILFVLAAIALLIRAMWRQFRERSIDPLFNDAASRLDEVGYRAEAAGERARGRWARLKQRLFGKAK